MGFRDDARDFEEAQQPVKRRRGRPRKDAAPAVAAPPATTPVSRFTKTIPVEPVQITEPYDPIPKVMADWQQHVANMRAEEARRAAEQSQAARWRSEVRSGRSAREREKLGGFRLTVTLPDN